MGKQTCIGVFGSTLRRKKDERKEKDEHLNQDNVKKVERPSNRHEEKESSKHDRDVQ